MFTSTTLHYIFVLCVQNCLLHLKLLSYNRHVGCVTKFLLERIVGLWMSPGCLFSSSPHPCESCVQCFSRLGLHHPPISTSCQNPSCGTCDGGMSNVCCGMAKAERPKGCSSPGSWQRPPCCPFWGWTWKNLPSCCCLCHCLVCHPGLWQPSWRQTRGTPFCGCAAPKKRRMPVSGIVHIHSLHCSAQLLCGSSRRGHSPPPPT